MTSLDSFAIGPVSEVPSRICKLQEIDALLWTIQRLPTKHNDATYLLSGVTSSRYWVVKQPVVLSRVDNQTRSILLGTIGSVFDRLRFHFHSKLFSETRC